MCGISGIFDPERPIDEGEFIRFTRALKHRGPDGEGGVFQGPVALGHTRLAILDLTEAGKCPMEYRAPWGTKYWITFNGEIFNFLELRKELEKLGHRFTNETDTQVLVAAFAEWGVECFPRFNGMWACAIWNETDKKLILSRDRFGIKPLYYSIYKDRLYFASELKAFLSLEGFPRELNTSLVPYLLKNHRYDGITHETLISHVSSLPPGHNILIDPDGTANQERWWETAHHLPSVPTRYEEQVEKFRELFLDAVRIRLRSDVPITTCLSGGLDSSAVYSAIAHLSRNERQGKLERCSIDWQQAFIATFPGTKIDEREFADIVVRHTGTRPHYWEFDGKEAIANLVETMWTLDEPAGGYVAPVWSLYRELRKNKIVVSLDGHGCDELCGGYPWFLDWMEKDVNSNLYQDFHRKILPSILRNFDRCSMAHGIEVRMPFMDYRLVTFAFALPPTSKIGGGFTKRVVRDALKGYMPEEIRTRRQKLGFNVPLTDWFNEGMAPLIERVVTHRTWLQSPYFNGPELGAQILSRTKSKSWKIEDWGPAFQVSTLLNFTLWQMLFIDKTISEVI